MVGKEEPLSKGKGNEMLLLRAEGTLTGKGGLTCVGREANENKV